MSNNPPNPRRSRAVSWNTANHSSRVPPPPPYCTFSEVFPLNRRAAMNQTTPTRSSPLSPTYNSHVDTENIPPRGQPVIIQQQDGTGEFFTWTPDPRSSPYSRPPPRGAEGSPMRLGLLNHIHKVTADEARRQLVSNWQSNTGQAQTSHQPNPDGPATIEPTTPQFDANDVSDFVANSAPAVLQNNYSQFDSPMDSSAVPPEHQWSDYSTSRSTGVTPMVLPSAPPMPAGALSSSPNNKGPQLLPSLLPNDDGGFPSSPPPAVVPRLPASPVINNRKRDSRTSPRPTNNARPMTRPIRRNEQSIQSNTSSPRPAKSASPVFRPIDLNEQNYQQSTSPRSANKTPLTFQPTHQATYQPTYQPTDQPAYQPTSPQTFQHTFQPIIPPRPITETNLPQPLSPSQLLASQFLKAKLTRHRSREHEIHAAFQNAQSQNLRPPTVYICNLCELRFLYTPFSIEPDDQGRAYCEECVDSGAHEVMERQRTKVAVEEKKEAAAWAEHGVDIGDHGVRMLIGGHLDKDKGQGQAGEGEESVEGKGKAKAKAMEESDVGDGVDFGGQALRGGLGMGAGWQGQFAGAMDPAFQGQYANPSMVSAWLGQHGGSGDVGGQDVAGAAGPVADPWQGREDGYEQEGFDCDAYFAEDDESMN